MSSILGESIQQQEYHENLMPSLHHLSILFFLYLPNPFFFRSYISTICAPPNFLYFLLSILLWLYLLRDHVILLELRHLFPSTFCIYSSCPLSGFEWWSWAHLVVSDLAPGNHYSMRSKTIYWTLLYSVWPKSLTHRWGWYDYWWLSIWTPRPRRADSWTGDHAWKYWEPPYYQLI